jgi:hypothetical protein
MICYAHMQTSMAATLFAIEKQEAVCHHAYVE